MNLNLGDEVRVVVKHPNWGWGTITPKDIGVITGIDYDFRYYYVRFKNHSHWKAARGELGLVTREPDWEV